MSSVGGLPLRRPAWGEHPAQPHEQAQPTGPQALAVARWRGWSFIALGITRSSGKRRLVPFQKGCSTCLPWRSLEYGTMWLEWPLLQKRHNLFWNGTRTLIESQRVTRTGVALRAGREHGSPGEFRKIEGLDDVPSSPIARRLGSEIRTIECGDHDDLGVRLKILSLP